MGLVKKVLKWAGIVFVAMVAFGAFLDATDGSDPVASSTPAVSTAPSSSPTAAVTNWGKGVDALVTEVVDGDTIDVQFSDGTTERIRLIGIDTPETVHPSKPVGCFGPEASSFTKSSLEGQTVRLELDVEERDRYGRLLAYVFVGDELFNETLVREGYALVSTYPPNVKYVDLFTEAQDEAEASGAGFWTDCATPSPVPTKTSSGSGGSECDPSYPDVCIPPISVSGDLDCGDLAFTNIRVLPPDPHGLDGDGNGYACTS